MTILKSKDVLKRHDDGSTTVERHAVVDGRGRVIVADVVDDAWRQRLVDAFNAHETSDHANETVDALQMARDALQEAMDVHIYDADQGEEPEPDCGYVATVKALEAAIVRERARPDLLAALKGCAELLFHLGTAGKTTRRDEEIEATRGEILAVINRAEGR
jgi:hypothetical protein